MQTQNYKNHSQFVPVFHFVILPLLVVVFIGSIVNFNHSTPATLYSASLLLVLSFTVTGMAFFLRSFVLKVQDRAIRSEENFRHFLATGQPQDTRLTMPQIIALRFAGDDEYIALSKKAVAENMSAKDIKLAILHWKGDYHRA